MPYPETAEGFCVTDVKKWSDFTKQEVSRPQFKLKPFEDRDIDIAIDACGVCASDVHTITGGWGSDIPLPLCVGHEVIGRAIKVGKGVTTIKVGDRVGVGAQIGADLTCDNCKADQENYCPNAIDTYGAPYPDGTIAQGGYASHIRAHEYFTFKIPDNLETSLAAPMLCAGLTTYSPLVRLGAGPGKKVGIVGLGGLGHFGVLWAKSLGAEVYVLSHTPSKKEDALKLGASHFVCTKDKDWAAPLKFKLDFIINTADATDKFNLPDYFSTLKVNGKFHMVGFPDNPLPQIQAQAFAPNGCYMGASHIGNRPEMLAMLELASKQDIKSWVQTIDISEKGCKEAVERVYNNDNVRYRFTLTGFDKAFGKRE
ncbi:GroES-like protein [Saccharata proteae CBS 121410]|uniref:alcohol dehydrogenase (NADP(+)) n=1 Tax=Saccharata proteae CBS 121410 TaxID=1314787 RepID=A0A9P4HZD7_9PEZI|nr:GroES-like protein [Saccharata proteae CBS 121410]